MDRILLCRTGWMKSYRGSTGDALTGKSAWIKEHGSGHEIYNFLLSGARVFGYVDFRGEMNLGRIDPAAEGQDSLDNVLVVWCAPHPRGGVWVVGWYEGATVYAAQRLSPNLKKRVDPQKPSKPCAWSITAEAKNVRLLPMDMRSLRVPRAFALRSYVRYLDVAESKAAAFRKVLKAYVAGGWKKGKASAGNKGGYQQDVEKRLRVEKAAMDTVAGHFASLSFEIKPVPKENSGWDIEARRDDLLLRVEVKGCSGPIAAAELTPNEYAMSSKFRDSYRICLVTTALVKPKLRTFAWDAALNRWSDDDGARLIVEEVTGARVRVR